MSSLAEAETYLNEGMAHVRSRNYASAAECFERAAAADPSYRLAHNNLGATWAAMGRHEEAIAAFERAVEIEPNYAQAHFNLGASLQTLGHREKAFNCFVRAIEIDPSHDEAFYYLGMEHQDAGRLNEALACYIRSCDLNPNAAHVFIAMGRALFVLNRPHEATRAFDNALRLNSNDSVVAADLLQLLARDCDWDGLDERRDSIPRLGVDGDPIPPFSVLALEDEPLRHRIRSEKYAAASYPSLSPAPASARPSTRPERLRIGYFSSDFHDHPVFYCSARMFELHDRERFEIHAYSLGPARTGAMRERAVRAFDSFSEVGHLSDQEIADLARTHGIDIAVDLNGYTEHQRLGLFARRPAPVQMTYLGYPGTLGTRFIDYLIADPTVVPPPQRAAYAEQVIYLPHCYQATDNSRPVPEPLSRADAGLPREGFVFCCFNSSYKISRAAFDIWMELLRQVDGSLLWLTSGSGRMEANLRREAARHSIDPDRLIIAPRAGHDLYMRRLASADLFLDTFIYNAHGTGGDTLWAGTPMVTKTGRGFASRVATSLLHSAGLPELVAASERDYAQIALSLAQDPARLAAIRARLAASRTSAPLFDSEQFTRNMEKAFDQAFVSYLGGQEPVEISI